MKTLRAVALALLAVVASFAPARATECDQLSGGVGVCLPRYGTDFDQWATADINALTLLNNGSTSAVQTAKWLQVQRISGVSTGTPNVWISSPTMISVASSTFDLSFVTISSGSMLVQSTSATAGHPIFTLRDYRGTNLWTVKETGNVTASFGVSAASVTITNGLDVSSITTHATGAAAYALELSTGMKFVTALTGIVWQDGSVSTSAKSGIATGGGGHKLSTATISGSSVTADSTVFTAVQRSTAVFDTAGFELIDDGTHDATIIKVKGLQVVASTTVYPSGTATGADFTTCLANSTATITMGNNKLLILFSGSASIGSGNIPAIQFLVDGAQIPGYEGDRANTSCGNGTSDTNCTASALTSALSAGTHNVCMRVRTTAGTVTIPAVANDTNGAQLTLIEQATGGQGYAAPALAQGYIPTTNVYQTATSLGVAITGSTLSWTSSGAPTAFDADLPILAFNAGAWTSVGVIVDGQFIDGESNSVGLSGTLSAGTNAAGFISMHHISTAIAAGSHSAALVYKYENASGVKIPYDPGTNFKPQFSITEIRNAPGTGDVSSNGSNTFSGSAKFGTNGTDVNGAWSSWTPTWSGFSVAPTGTYRYFRLGRLIIAYVTISAVGTSNATAHSITLPAAAANTGVLVTGMFQCQDNGITQTGACSGNTVANSTTLNLYKDFAGGGWTASGNSYVGGIVIYESNSN